MPFDLPVEPPVIEAVDWPFLSRHQVDLRILRLDRIHPLLTGNKWFKLKHNLKAARAAGCTRLVTLGGAYSNHIYAVAAAGRLFGFDTVGLIRGELALPLNPVLEFARACGMELVPVTRKDYRSLRAPENLAALAREFPAAWLLPEGGSNELALKGCAEIAAWLRWNDGGQQRLLALACGTGATLAGVILGLQQEASPPQVLGVGVLNAPGYLPAQVNAWLSRTAPDNQVQWQLAENYHCGGYGRVSGPLRELLTEFREVSAIPLEPLYTGKLVFALKSMIAAGAIPPGTEILAIHSGGLVPGPVKSGISL